MKTRYALQIGAILLLFCVYQHRAVANARRAAKKDITFQKKGSEPDPVAIRAWQASLDKRIGRAPEKVINLYNTWTKEILSLPASGAEPYLANMANRFLRCHFTNEATQMDERLLPTLVRAAKRFRVDRVNVVSGFRDPKYNLILRKKGRQVARNSQHTLGHAVDFRLPGVPIRALHRWAKSLRLGGVGFYRHSHFIHVDVGPVRYWNGR